MWGSDKKDETPVGSDSNQNAANNPEGKGLFSDWEKSRKTASNNDGIFSNFGNKSANPKGGKGMFSNLASPDESPKVPHPGADKEGMFSNWNTPADTDADKGGLFSKLGNKDKSDDGLFNFGNKDNDDKKLFPDWGNKDKDKGLFSNLGKKDDEGGLFSNFGNNDNKDSKFTDRFPGMQPEPSVENKAPAADKPWFGGKDKEPDDADNKGNYLDKLLGKDREGEKEKPGLFDKMLGKDKEPPPEKSKKPGMFDNLIKRNDKIVDDPKTADDKEKKPGLFDKMLGGNKDKAASDKSSAGLKKRKNKLPGLLTLGTTSGGDVEPSRRKPTTTRDPDVSTRTVIMIPLLILTLLVVYLAYQYQKAKENSLGSGMSGGMVAEYLEYAFPTQSDWCGHPIKKPSSTRVQPAPLAALIVTNTTVFSRVSDEYDKMIKIFPEMVVANGSTQPGQTAFILCISEPVFILTIDLMESTVKLTTLAEPCKASSTFRDAVEASIDGTAENSFTLKPEAKTETIPFAVTVNVRKKRAEFVLCEQGPDGCLNPVEFMKATFEKLNAKKGITDFALVYSDNANSFKSRPKYICEVSQSEIQMCWNPKTYAPVPCFKP